MPAPLVAIPAGAAAIGSLVDQLSRNAVAMQQAENQNLAIQYQGQVELHRIEAQKFEIEAQKEVYLALIDGAERLYKRKLKGFFKMMNRAQDLIEAQSKSLSEEKAEITKSLMLDDMAENQQAYFSLRRSEIETALADIRLWSFRITQAVEAVMLEPDALSSRLSRT